MSRRATWLIVGPALGWMLVAAACLGGTVEGTDAQRGDALSRSPPVVVGSEDCKGCHAEEHAAWYRSFHRTMTQSAQGAAVLAPFDGETLRLLGFEATMHRDGQGRPVVTVREQGASGAPRFTAAVELTIGSHRYQQYVARIDRGGGTQERWRIPVAWHIAERRWIHLGGAFLFADTAAGDWDGWSAHLSRWNDNCLFCHNTAVNPGKTATGAFETTYGELGIGCEACHGKGQAHAERQGDPFHRLAAALGDERDPAVTHPARLGPDRSSEICGRCHGNRIGHDLESILTHGDDYIPGEPLAQWSRPIFAHSALETEAGTVTPFAPRFWPDGTPRLSAYEYQGLLLSPCHDDGAGLGCLDCHSMHGDDPNMQLRSDFDRTATCRGCHADERFAGPAHGGHQTIDCVDCHMPRTTYGLLEGMMSHRITAPDPGALLGRFDAPDACTQCHVDNDRAWACAAMAGLALAGSACGTAVGAPEGPSQVELDLIGGDPVQRALAAHALASVHAVGSVERRAQALSDALEDDYPAVRWFAARGLAAVLRRNALSSSAAAALATYDFMADPSQRIPTADAVRGALGPSRIGSDPELFSDLVGRRDTALIEIGE